MKLFLTTLLLICTSAAFARQSLTLQQAIDYAIENNIQLQQTELGINQADIDYQQAKNAFLPSVNAFVSQNFNWGRSFDVLTNEPITQQVRSNNFALSLNQTIFDGFRLRNQLRQAEVFQTAAQRDVEAQKNTIMLNVANAYLQVLFNLEAIKQAEVAVANTQEQMNRTQQLVNAGSLPEAQLIDLMSQKATNDLNVVNANNTLALSYLNLKQLLQLEGDEAIEINVPSFPETITIAGLPTPAEVYMAALDLQPQIAADKLNVEAANIGVDIAQANRYPTLTLGGGINTFYSSAQSRIFVGSTPLAEPILAPIGFTDPSGPGGSVAVFQAVDESPEFKDATFFTQLDEALRYGINLNLSIPIYNRNQVRAGIETAQINKRRSEINLLQTKNQLRQAIEQSYADAVAAVNSYQANKKQVELLKEQFDLVEKRLANGAANATDRAVAENNLLNAQSQLLRSKYNYLFTREILDFYMGEEISLND